MQPKRLLGLMELFVAITSHPRVYLDSLSPHEANGRPQTNGVGQIVL